MVFDSQVLGWSKLMMSLFTAVRVQKKSSSSNTFLD